MSNHKSFIKFILLFFSVSIFLFPFIASAQNTTIGAGGSFLSIEQHSLGGYLTFTHKINERLYLNINTSYYNFSSVSVNPYSSYFLTADTKQVINKYVPVNMGGRFYIGNENINPYFNIEVGMNYASCTFYKSEEQVDGERHSKHLLKSESWTIIPSMGIGMGIEYSLNEKLKLDFNSVAHHGSGLMENIRFVVTCNYVI